MSAPLDERRIQNIVEAALLATDAPLTVDRLVKLFEAGELPEDGRAAVRTRSMCSRRPLRIAAASSSGWRVAIATRFARS
jgi:chromosome segregation and condensation protein ScpB